MWSTWPWVTSTETGLSRCSRTTCSTPRWRPCPGRPRRTPRPGRWRRRSSSCPTARPGSLRSARCCLLRAGRRRAVEDGPSLLAPAPRPAHAYDDPDQCVGDGPRHRHRRREDHRQRGTARDRAGATTRNGFGRVDAGRHGLRPGRRAGARRRAVPRGDSRGGARLLHQAVRRARVRGAAARAAGARRMRCPPTRRLESINRVAAQLVEPHAVGDIKALVARLDALKPVIGLQREKRREERAAPARGVPRAQGRDRRRGGEDRRRDATGATAPTGCATCSPSGRLLPRLDKAADDELWHRFSERPHDLHPGPQGALRRDVGEARRRPGDQGAPGQGGRGAGRLDRVGSDRGAATAP